MATDPNMTLEEKIAAYPLLLSKYGGSPEAYEEACQRSAQEARDIYNTMHPKGAQ